MRETILPRVHLDAGRLLSFAGGLLFIFAVTLADYAAGAEMTFSELYLLPVLWLGWSLGRGPAIAMAVVCAVAEILVDLGLPGLHPAIHVWNALFRLGTLLVAGTMVAALRAQSDALTAASARLQTELVREGHRARTDALTGLPNFRGFTEDISLALRADEPRSVCLVYLDVDNFKRVNDLYGHPAGDALLRGIAEVVRASIRTGDLPARIGGDEFVVALRGIEVPDAEQIAWRLVSRIKELGQGFPAAELGASVGLAWFREWAGPLDDAIAAADQAMYRAKNAGKNRVVMAPTGASPGPRAAPACARKSGG